MAGHMGDRNRTQQNLEIVHTDAARGLLFVKGSVPGSKGGWLIVKDAVKVDRHPDAPFPAGLRSAKHDEEPSVVEIDEGAVHRSEERRVGKGCVSTCKSRGAPDL